jgi:hypothetical protein
MLLLGFERTSVHSEQRSYLQEHSTTDDPRAKSGLRPLVTRPAKLFVNLLLLTTHVFI